MQKNTDPRPGMRVREIRGFVRRLTAERAVLEPQAEALRLLVEGTNYFPRDGESFDPNKIVTELQKMRAEVLGDLEINKRRLDAFTKFRSQYPPDCPECDGSGLKAEGFPDSCALCGGEGVWDAPDRLKEAAKDLDIRPLDLEKQ